MTLVVLKNHSSTARILKWDILYLHDFYWQARRVFPHRAELLVGTFYIILKGKLCKFKINGILLLNVVPNVWTEFTIPCRQSHTSAVNLLSPNQQNQCSNMNVINPGNITCWSHPFIYQSFIWLSLCKDHHYFYAGWDIDMAWINPWTLDWVRYDMIFITFSWVVFGPVSVR